MKTPPIEMLSLLEEAATVFPIPRDTDIRKMSETYSKILGWFSMDVLRRALQEYLTTQTRRFPRPGDLFPLAKSIESVPPTTEMDQVYMDWYQAGMWGPCPVCQSVLEFPEIDVMQRAAIHHDVQRHKEMCLPVIGS